MQAADLLGTSAHRQTVYCNVFGGILPVTINIAATTYITTVDFSLFGSAYTFSPTTWSGRGFTAFLRRFHECGTRDVIQFGAVTVSSEGESSVQMDATQKYSAVIQARQNTGGSLCKHIMSLSSKNTNECAGCI